MRSVKRTHFHRVHNEFSLKSVVTVVTDRNFTPRTTTLIRITVHIRNCTLFSIQQAPLLLYGKYSTVCPFDPPTQSTIYVRTYMQ